MTAGVTLRALTGDELGPGRHQLIERAGFLVDGPQAGSSLRLPAGELLTALDSLPASVRVVIFVDELGHGTDLALDGPVVRALADAVDDGVVHAAIRPVPATDAVKRVDDGWVVESVDRETLNPVLAPEVVARDRLRRALAGVDADRDVNPTERIARSGGTVRVVDLPVH